MSFFEGVFLSVKGSNVSLKISCLSIRYGQLQIVYNL